VAAKIPAAQRVKITTLLLPTAISHEPAVQATYAYWLVHADLGHHGPLMGDPRNAWMSSTFERVPGNAGKDALADQAAAVCCQTD